MSKEQCIKVVIPITEQDIRNLISINNRFKGRHDKVDEPRLVAALGTEFNLEDIVELEDVHDKAEYGRFLMGVSAAIISQLKLIK